MLNVILDLVFVGLLNMGPGGAALATVIGQAVSFLFALALLYGIFTRIGLSLLLGVVFSWGIRGFWYGNALSGLVPFLIGSVYLFSGKWKTIE